eukprot:COSAG01_NODE_2017_length_8638_cov_15.453917_15_plen_65_part_00
MRGTPCTHARCADTGGRAPALPTDQCREVVIARREVEREVEGLRRLVVLTPLELHADAPPPSHG